MSVTLSPSSQLGFQRPLTTLVKRTLSVSNHNSDAIAYKVKTTAPKQYCVRPNSGRIEPGETVEVQVLLQPMKEDPPAGTKCRDKFLVQSVVITTERENIPLTELWGVVEKEKGSANGVEQIHEQKIRCTYLPAADEPVNQSIPEEQSTPSKADTTANPDSSFVSTINSTAPSSTSASSPAPSSPPTGMPSLGEPTAVIQPRVQARDLSDAAPTSSSTSTPSSNLPTTSTASQSSTTPSTSASYVDTAREKATAAATLASGALASAAVTAASGLSNVAHSIDPEVKGTSSGGADEVSRLKTELSQARAEISRLESELATSGGAGLRNRGTGATSSSSKGSVGSETSSKVVEMQGAEGVPVQTVAAIAFAVFLFTWMFL
ncbi:hypothetical protein JCM11491_002988 [Sporobolomyces phaffii]